MFQLTRSPIPNPLITTFKHSIMKDQVLEMFAQIPLEIYTQISFCFSLDNSTTKDNVVQTLQRGLKELSDAFPWIAGQVFKDPHSGVYKVVDLDSTPRLVVKDSAGVDKMSFEQLRKENFPCKLLDEQDLAPRSTIPGIFSDSESKPVFIVQATFVQNGVIVTFLAHHQVLDGTGEATIISHLSTLCCGKSLKPEDIKVGNLERENLIQLFNADEEADYGPIEQKLGYQIVPSNPPASGETVTSYWANFVFLASSLSELKKLACADLLPGKKYISTDDALTAFIWQAVCRVRLSRVLNVTSTIARAVDVRSYLGVPSSYPGVVNNMTYNEEDISELVKKPLGHIASELRSRLNGTNLRDDSRALATLVSRTRHSPITSGTATINASYDIALSSWAKQNSYSLDFGFGLPESVRRPQFTPVESLMYILPRSLDGEIGLAICLRENDMEMLRQDKTMRHYATYIG